MSRVPIEKLYVVFDIRHVYLLSFVEEVGKDFTALFVVVWLDFGVGFVFTWLSVVVSFDFEVRVGLGFTGLFVVVWLEFEVGFDVGFGLITISEKRART